MRVAFLLWAAIMMSGPSQAFGATNGDYRQAVKFIFSFYDRLKYEYYVGEGLYFEAFGGLIAYADCDEKEVRRAIIYSENSHDFFLSVRQCLEEMK